MVGNDPQVSRFLCLDCQNIATYKTYPPEGERCPACGGQLKFVPEPKTEYVHPSDVELTGGIKIVAMVLFYGFIALMAIECVGGVLTYVTLMLTGGL